MVSVYMPDERISMFPYTLSTELLSLGAGLDSYALSCGVTLDELGVCVLCVCVCCVCVCVCVSVGVSVRGGGMKPFLSSTLHNILFSSVMIFTCPLFTLRR